MKKLYGSLNNRIDEGKNYLGRELQKNDDITMYYYSDRNCYYIEEVINQKEIKVKPYHVCADLSKKCGQGHQNWLYFKSVNELNKYINKNRYNGEEHLPTNLPESKSQTWVYRYGKWMEKISFNKETIDRIINRDGYCLLRAKNEKEQKLLDEGKEVNHYINLRGEISFGVKDYYWDWEF